MWRLRRDRSFIYSWKRWSWKWKVSKGKISWLVWRNKLPELRLSYIKNRHKMRPFRSNNSSCWHWLKKQRPKTALNQITKINIRAVVSTRQIRWDNLRKSRSISQRSTRLANRTICKVSTPSLYQMKVEYLNPTKI